MHANLPPWIAVHWLVQWLVLGAFVTREAGIRHFKYIQRIIGGLEIHLPRPGGRFQASFLPVACWLAPFRFHVGFFPRSSGFFSSQQEPLDWLISPTLLRPTAAVFDSISGTNDASLPARFEEVAAGGL